MRIEQPTREQLFSAFVGGEGLRLRRVLVAHHGVDVGMEATAAALAYAWANWDRVGGMSNPVGYLYRVGQSHARRERRWQRATRFPARDAWCIDRSIDAEMFDVLALLSHEQRVSVLLVHAHNWSYVEVAEVLGTTVDAVRNHVHRGTRKLRRLLRGD